MRIWLLTPWENFKMTEIEQLLQLHEYDLVKAMYTEELAQNPIWKQEYVRLMQAKDYANALKLAQSFSAPRAILRQVATELVLFELQQNQYKVAVQYLEENPVDFEAVQKAFLSMPELHSNKEWIKLNEALNKNIQVKLEDVEYILKDSCKILSSYQNKRGSIFVIPAEDEVLLGGDLHGHTQNLSLLLQKADLENHPNRHLVLQEIIHTRGLLIDQRDFSFLEILHVLKYAIQYPNRVHIILGNHDYNVFIGKETAMKKRRVNMYFERGLKKLFPNNYMDIYKIYKEQIIPLFPAAIEYGDLLFSHSNPNFDKFPDFSYRGLEENIPFGENKDIAAIVEGRDHTLSMVERFLQQTKAKFSIIGHEICRLGYEIPHMKQIIVDSCHPYGYYFLFENGRYTSSSKLHTCLNALQPDFAVK